MQLTRHELDGHAEFAERLVVPVCKSCPFPDQAADIPLGLYELPRRSGEAHLYRLNHPLAEAVVAQAKSRELALGGDPVCLRRARWQGYAAGAIGRQVGLADALASSASNPRPAGRPPDVLAAATETAQVLDEEAAARLMTLAPGRSGGRNQRGGRSTHDRLERSD